MKKVLLSLAMLLVAHVASAQFVVGGQIGASSISGRETIHAESGPVTTEYAIPYDSESSILFAPKVGYQLSEKMQVGVALNFTHLGVNLHSMFDEFMFMDPEFEGDYKVRTNVLAIAPYLRYNVANLGKFTAFVEAQASFGFGFNPTVSIHTVGLNPNVDTSFKVDTKTFDFCFVVVPGLNYQFNERISMDLYLDIVSLGYRYSSMTEREDVGTPELSKDFYEHRFNGSEFFFGANLNPMSLSDHLGFCRLGFNFHF